MGQAKKRGTAEQRKAEAIEAGRIKTPNVQPWHDVPQFELKGYQKSLIHGLMHNLTSGAERLPSEIPEDSGTQGDMTP